MASADVWIVSILADDDGAASALTMLTPEEQMRAARFRYAENRRSYVYSHAALRILLGRARAARFEDRSFARGAHGKPFIAGGPHFSLSRSGDCAAIGICSDHEIGVDIERVVHDANTVDVFTAAERSWLDRSRTSDERRRRYFRLWVIREAIVKATGKGLSQALAEGDIAIERDAPSLPPESEWQIVEPGEAAGDSLRGYAAAAVVPRGCAVAWRRADWAELASRISSPPAAR